jgi:hypothetical protein
MIEAIREDLYRVELPTTSITKHVSDGQILDTADAEPNGDNS